MHSPGYYVHIEPDELFVGVGMWRPDSDPLRRIRERIAAKPAEWQRTVGDRTFRRHFSLGGERLTRPPRGFDKEHVCIEDIKRKSFIAVKEMDAALSVSPELQHTVREVHPEVCFWALSGGRPMASRKSRPEGREERIAVLAKWIGEDQVRHLLVAARSKLGMTKTNLADDDILDAAVALWTAERIVRDEALTLPEAPPKDSRGLPMEMVY